MWGLPAPSECGLIQSATGLGLRRKFLSFGLPSRQGWQVTAPEISTNSVLVLENGIAMSLKDHNGAEMSDSNFYGKESGTRMRGKKNLMASNLS